MGHYMKVTIDTQTTWDLMINNLVELDNINYDLDSPDWYWLPDEWTRFKAKKIVVETRLSKLDKALLDEEYPSCIVENWWL